jgi:hypothetical protein
MTIEEFAEKHRLKIEITPDGEKIIPSRSRRFTDCHIFQHDDAGSVFGLILVGFRSQQLPQGYIERQKVALLALGSRASQEADNEAVFLFDPENEAQTKAVIVVGKISRRRVVNLSPEQKEALRKRMVEVNSARKRSA